MRIILKWILTFLLPAILMVAELLTEPLLQQKEKTKHPLNKKWL